MQNIGLQDLIYQVKRELISTNQAQRAKDPYPLFFIDQIELEISVRISQTADGSVKLSVMDFAEVSTGKSVSREQGHVVKVSLSPSLSRDEILAQALADEHVRQIVRSDEVRALLKGEEKLAGEQE